MIALQLAAGRPELVNHLVLCATSPSAPVTRRWLMLDVVSKIPIIRNADGQPSFAFGAQRAATKSLRRSRAALPD